MTLVEPNGDGSMMHLGVAAGIGHEPVTIVVVTIAAVLTALLVSSAVIAAAKRQSRSYLLIVLALTSLLSRSATGVLAYFFIFPTVSHHLLEHGLDVAIAVFIIAAVYFVEAMSGMKPAARGADR